MRKAAVHIQQRVRERRLIILISAPSGGSGWRRKASVVAVVQRPAAKGQQRARRVVCGHQRGGRAQPVPAERRGERALGGHRPDLLADPAVDRRGRDRILDVPVGAFMLEADRRPHQARARRQCEPVRAHRAEAQIGLAEARLGAFAALQRADDGCRQRPSELRLPDEADVAELRLEVEVAVAGAARAKLAEAAVNPASLAIDRRPAGRRR